MASSSKSNNWTKYDKVLLDKLVARDGAKLIDQEFGKLTKTSVIKFTCKCGNNDEKQLRLFVHHGGVFCRGCASKAAKEKTQATCIEKYGAPTPFQSKEFRDTTLRLSKKGVKYNKALLDEVLEKDGASIKETYERYTFDTIIHFQCECGEEHEKQFKSLVQHGGAKCEKCTLKGMHEKQVITMEQKGQQHPFTRLDVREKARQNNKGLKYTKELLDGVIKRDEAILKNEYDGLTRDVVIEFECKCGQENSKSFRALIENAGAKCKDCSELVRKDKHEKTCIENYGVSNPMQSKDVAQKIKISTNTFTVERLKESLGDNLVGEYDPTTIGRDSNIRFKCYCCDEEGEKPFRMIEESIGPFCKECTWVAKDYLIKKSLKENYDVEYSLQHPAFNDKASAKGRLLKPYTTPGGNVLMYQGYEHLALDLLFMQDYDENDIINEKQNVPHIWWVDADGQEHRYYVDIYLKSENRMIEVKSDYRYEKDKDKLEFVWRTCVAEGFTYEVWIFNKYHELVTIKDYNYSSLSSSTSTSTS
jgi:hypothetical protein